MESNTPLLLRFFPHTGIARVKDVAYQYKNAIFEHLDLLHQGKSTQLLSKTKVPNF